MTAKRNHAGRVESALAAMARVAATAALEAGTVIRSHYDQPHQVCFKGFFRHL